jgi:hypothetical protein
MLGNPPINTLRRFFAGIAEYVFHVELGVVDPPVIDYVSDMMVRFVRCDAIYRIRNLTGNPLTDVASMLSEANERIGDARREVHRHIGDFTLFWTGLYPEALRRMQSPDKLDHFLDYCTHGKRAYRIAGDIQSSRKDAIPGDVLYRLSDDFEMCAYGLREVRREWERRDDDDVPRPLLLN